MGDFKVRTLKVLVLSLIYANKWIIKDNFYLGMDLRTKQANYALLIVNKQTTVACNCFS